ncbi:class I SAM-dependent methyltransferase [Mycobacterium sp. NPDC050551]|uniref:class I SAM-dependent methyltransferase n=1 Tax=Mycobacterium sp. NPDC050551 TaxID=3155407 RepID=UPI0034403990
MPVMSRIERAFCCGALWRRSTDAVVGTLQVDRLGRDVLEIGSGSGAVAAALQDALPGASVTATDLDPVMVATADRRLRPYPAARAVPADATALPFADEAFDSVVSCLMLHHVIDWETAVGEIARVLRPGGVFVGYDLVRTPAATWLHRLDRSPFRLLTPPELGDACRAEGLSVDVEPRYRGQAMRFLATR